MEPALRATRILARRFWGHILKLFAAERMRHPASHHPVRGAGAGAAANVGIAPWARRYVLRKARREARRMASIRLPGSAFALPAMSKAVP